MKSFGFRRRYRVLHFTNEMGSGSLGGIGTCLDELYRARGDDVGFVHLWQRSGLDREVRYPGSRDILQISSEELHRIPLDCSVAVVHYYGLWRVLERWTHTETRLVYVVHSVPTTEPCFKIDPFGGQEDVRLLFEKAASLADRIVVVSESERAKLTALYPRFGGKATVIANGLDFETGAERKPYPQDRFQPTRKRVLGFLGRFDYRKGLLECLEAIQELDAELWIAGGIGSLSYLNSVLTWVRAARMEDRVRFLGMCVGARKRAFLRHIGALVVPSLYEPFGYVVLEAVREGTPVLTTLRGGAPSILGTYPFCFDPYEPGGLTRCIRRFLAADVDQLDRLTSEVRQRCSSLFSARQMADRYAQVLGEM